ncbi:riboflavin kinase [Halorhodospira halochloris]|uniref:Riboflavin biosynthesis protein n=1 Tax=Halorhodospira halochloris TaxID=1052 RepID=A0A0X8X828_HALHR|nr:bifunctional riboflavin kinase/FAD synthetase [Halorhodospira halochloris]MBK1651457.1 riboflavin biosynthesis protein RibF [Halorhodospira halochloris]BAU57284.1 riboflavin kinase [Halorhodospira halochloris]
MELIRGIHNIRHRHRGAAVTIGNFDGVHRGHQAMIARLREQASRRGCPAYVVTFEPHPAEYLTPHRAPARLTGWREKLRRLGNSGIDGVVVLRFDQHLAGLDAASFATDLLGERLGVSHVLVGDDFRFGCARGGDLNLLLELGKRAGFDVCAMETIEVANERVSSTRVRAAIALGDFAAAEQMLGEPYRVSGRVVRGDAMGRRLGWPTANLRLAAARLPLQGIYAARVCGDDLRDWPAAVSVGVRPTVDGRVAVFEVHLIGFEGDLYGSHLSVEPVKWLRGAKQFADLNALAAQIGRDIQQAEQVLRGNPDSDEALK